MSALKTEDKNLNLFVKWYYLIQGGVFALLPAISIYAIINNIIKGVNKNERKH